MSNTNRDQLAETIRQTVEMFKSETSPKPATDSFLTISVVDAPAEWKEEGYEHAVAMTMELFGEECSLLVNPEEADRFVDETRKLRKRSRSGLTDQDSGDIALYLQRLSESYVLTFDCWRHSRPRDAKPELDYAFLGEKAHRGVLLSDDQVTEFLANLEHAAKEAMEYVEIA